MIIIKIDTTLDKVNAMLKELGNVNITSLPCEPIPGIYVCEDNDVIELIETKPEEKPEEKKRRKNGV